MKPIFINLQLVLIQILIYSNCNINCEPENNWIDPFKLETLQMKESDNQSTGRDDGLAYYKRTINLILSSVIQETSGSTYRGKLHIDMSSEDYIFLKKFANINIEEPLTLQRVDQILTNSLIRSRIDEISGIFLSWSDYIYYLIFNRITCVYLMILLVLIVTYKLLRTSYSLYQVVLYLIALGYVIDFAITWKRLLQELEITKYAESFKFKEMPASCKLSEMSGWQLVLSFLSNRNDCKEYYKIILSDVFYDVGPLDVITHQLGKIMTVLGGSIGISLSKLTSGLASDLPFPFSILLVPILLIFILAFMWVVLSAFVTHKKNGSIFDKDRRKFEIRERKEIKRKQEFEQMKATFQKHQSEIEKIEKWKGEKEKRIGFSTQGKYKKILHHEKRHNKNQADVPA